MLGKSWLTIFLSLLVLFCLNLLMASSLAPGLLLKQLIAWTIGIGLFFLGRESTLNKPLQPNGYSLSAPVSFCLLPSFLTISPAAPAAGSILALSPFSPPR